MMYKSSGPAVAALLLLAWGLWTAPKSEGQSSPGEELRSAIAAYESAEFERAELLLRRLNATQLAEADRIHFYQYLGVLELLADRPTEARAAFVALLELSPRHSLDAKVFPPQILAVFSEARAALALRSYDLGLEALLDQKFELARDLLRQVLLLAPDHPQAGDHLKRAEDALLRAAEEQRQQEPTPPALALRVVSPAAYQVGKVEFQGSVYLDRCYNFAQIPEGYQGLDFIRPANEDKEQLHDVVLEVDQAVEVFVALDKRARELPDWLRAFQAVADEIVLLEEKTEEGRRSGGCKKMNTLMRLRNEEVGPSFTYRLYKKRFSAGQIVLGPNEPREKPGRHNMYLVLVRPYLQAAR